MSSPTYMHSQIGVWVEHLSTYYTQSKQFLYRNNIIYLYLLKTSNHLANVIQKSPLSRGTPYLSQHLSLHVMTTNVSTRCSHCFKISYPPKTSLYSMLCLVLQLLPLWLKAQSGTNFSYVCFLQDLANFHGPF